MILRARIWRYALALVVSVLPFALVFQALLTGRDLREMRTVYLRSRAAALAGRLENLPILDSGPAPFEPLYDEESALLDAVVIAPDDPSAENARLGPIWRGRELFRTEYATVDGVAVFRAYVPFHSASGLRIARIDLDAAGADFLTAQAGRDLAVSVIAGLALWALAVYALLQARRRTALERRQLELEHMAHLGRLSAVLAHEIRNPLGTIKGFMQLAAERAEGGVSSTLAPALDEVRRLENLVRDLLLYGRPAEPAAAPVEWRDLTRELAVSVPNGAARLSFTPESMEFRSDPNLLRQILLNLIRNSVEALEGAPEPQVRVELSRQPGRGVRISVSDNGPGLPREVKDKLFEPFVTTKASGTGLGLPIAKRLVESLGGTLQFHDNQPHGAVAEILLPEGYPGREERWNRS